MKSGQVRGIIVVLAVSLVAAMPALWTVTKSNAAIYDPGPIAAYSFDEGEGSTVEDAAGEHDGTVEGPGWTKGRIGKALEFDGEAGDLVTVPGTEDLQLEEFTVEAWVRPDKCGLLEPVVARLSDEDFGYALYAGGDSDAGYPEGYILDGKEIDSHAVDDEALPLHAWSHIAVTNDGNKLRLYVNGELVDTGWSSDVKAGGEGPLTIGGNEAFEAGEYFSGKVDEVRIYERALDESDLRQTMNAGFPIAVTEAATEIEANDAILNGTANPNGGEAGYFFEYGPTETYGSVVMGEELGSDREDIGISEAVIDLAPETTYHYRLVADNPAGTAYGEDETLTTPERTMTAGEEEELTDAEDKMELMASESKAGPGDFYGMMWTGDLEKMRKQNIFEAVERSGAKMLRLGVAPGDQTEIDNAFKAAAEGDITVLPGLGGGPFPKAGTKNRENWIEYAEKLVKKYGPDSSFSHPVTAWEIWNEPNMPFEGASADQEGNVNPEAFAVFFKEMAQALRSASKGGIQILTPGLYGYRVGRRHPFHLTPRAFLKRMDQKLSELEYDNAYNAISLHPYVFKTANPQHPHQQHEPRNTADVKQISRQIKGAISAIHALKPDKPLWITELGFPIANPGNKGHQPPVTGPIQKQLVQASFSMMQSNRSRLKIAHAFYYNIQDDSKPGWEYHSGLLTLKGKARSAWIPFYKLAGGKPCPHAPC